MEMYDKMLFDIEKIYQTKIFTCFVINIPFQWGSTTKNQYIGSSQIRPAKPKLTRMTTFMKAKLKK